MFRSVVGHSEDLDAADAAAEIIERCSRELEGAPVIGGLLFVDIEFDLPLIASRLAEAFPGIELIGATTDGEISSQLGFAESSAVLQLFASDEVEAHATVIRGVSKMAPEDIDEVVGELLSRSAAESKLCIALPESLTMSGTELTARLRHALGPDVTLVGGASGDNRRVEMTHQIYGSEVLHDAVPLLLFSGPLLFSHGCYSGWEPVGSVAKVTESRANLIVSIDDQPAMRFLERYLGDLSRLKGAYAEYPFIVDAGDGKQRLISVLAVNSETGEVTCFGHVPTGSAIRLSEADRGMVIKGTEQSVKLALESYPGEAPGAAVVFSCAGRKAMLGTQVPQEAEIVSATVPELTVGGFYTYGEISPSTSGGESLFHNETFVTVLMGTR